MGVCGGDVGKRFSQFVLQYSWYIKLKVQCCSCFTSKQHRCDFTGIWIPIVDPRTSATSKLGNHGTEAYDNPCGVCGFSAPCLIDIVPDIVQSTQRAVCTYSYFGICRTISWRATATRLELYTT